eukprot:Em0010g361a
MSQMMEKDLEVKNEKLKQVKELIQNSPCSRTPFKEINGCEGDNGQHQKGSEQVQVEQQQQVADGATAAACTTVPAPVKGKGELLQPIMKKKKTVSTPTTKDLNNKQVDKYCLQHQEQDSDGDVKTKLFKGEIKQTVGGGTSVQFTDVEVLHHSRPATLRKPASPIKKMKRSASANQCNSSQSSEGFTDRSTSDEEWTDVETRCAVAIEGRPGSQPAFTHAQLSRRGPNRVQQCARILQL